VHAGQPFAQRRNPVVVAARQQIALVELDGFLKGSLPSEGVTGIFSLLGAADLVSEFRNVERERSIQPPLNDVAIDI
jgi:hypothetical protein